MSGRGRLSPRRVAVLSAAIGACGGIAAAAVPGALVAVVIVVLVAVLLLGDSHDG